MEQFPGIPDRSLEACGDFVADPFLRDWAMATLVGDGPLHNPDHWHLRFASLLFVWAPTTFRSQGRVVVGTAQLGKQQGANGKREFLEWSYARLNGGELPDFVVTLCAPWFQDRLLDMDGRAVCAVIDHELYHCGQEVDPVFGVPKFTKAGLPKFAVRGHDVEEFVGVAARWGAWSEGLEQFRQALNNPQFPAGSRRDRGLGLEAVCGCGALVRSTI